MKPRPTPQLRVVQEGTRVIVRGRPMRVVDVRRHPDGLVTARLQPEEAKAA